MGGAALSFFARRKNDLSDYWRKTKKKYRVIGVAKSRAGGRGNSKTMLSSS